jgi:hypothetical protein
MPADRRRDGAGGRVRRAVGDAEIPFLHLAGGEGAAEAGVGRRRARHHQRAARALVEPVDDPRPAGAADAGHLGIAVEEMVGEGPRGAAGAGMHGEARRLVDHHHFGVLVQQAELAGLRGDPLFLRRRRAALDAIAGGDEGRRLRAVPVDGYELVGDPALDLIAGNVEPRGDVAVEPLSRRLGLNRPGGHSATAAAGASRRCGRKLSMAISTMPIEIALSATLKEGQWCMPT